MNDEETAHRKRGGRMIFIGWAAAFAFAFLFFQFVLDYRQNPNQLSVLAAQDGALTLKRNAAGHYLAEGTLNGRKTTFLLDTGATRIAVPAHIADETGLPRRRLQRVSTAAGDAAAYSTVIEHLQIGGLVFSGMSGVIIPDMEGDTVLLGMNALEHLYITQHDGELSLRAAP